jgi:NADPH2:quinone reductase
MAHAPGAYCGTRTIPVSRLVRLPDAISDDAAAAIMLKGLTAQYLLRGAYAVRPGDIVLIHAAAGGVGLLMCQWARALGARVIGTVSTEEKAEVACQHGCDHAIINTRDDVVERVRELTGGAGVPVVYDSVGAATFDLSLACLRTRGTLVSFGTASGPVPPFDVFRLNRNHHLGQGGSLYLTSASVFDYTRDRSEYLSRAADLFEAVTTGRIRVPLNGRYALRDAARAHSDLESRRTTGCVILYP